MLEIAAKTRLSHGEQSFRELWLLLKREEQGERRKVMPQLMARARSVLGKSPPLASRTFEGHLAVLGLVLQGLKRCLLELGKEKP